MELAKAHLLRDELGELELADCKKANTAANEVKQSQLHVAQILQGEKIHIDYGQLFAPDDARLNAADVLHLQTMEHTTREGLQELFHKAFESFRASVATETAKITMEVDDRVAKRKLSEADDVEDAGLANRNEPPAPTPPPPSTPLAPTLPSPTTANATGSKDGGGSTPQAATRPPKQARTDTEETPEQKQKRIHDATVKPLEEDSVARGRKAYELILAANADDL